MTTTGTGFNPTKQYSDDRGYHYVETSDAWKTMCLDLPCFTAVAWPDYATKVVEDTIDGKPVVIQLWKGWCQKFLGRNDFPGGIGAEVGVYHRVLGKRPPAQLSFLPSGLTHLLGLSVDLADSHFWWPFPELNAEIDFELINPKTKQTFFRAGPERTYWMNKWMNTDSYHRYRHDQHGNVPLFSDHYQLRYRINGKTYVW